MVFPGSAIFTLKQKSPKLLSESMLGNMRSIDTLQEMAIIEKYVKMRIMKSFLGHAPHLKFRYLLSFGSNLGDREENMAHSIEKLSQFVLPIAWTEAMRTAPLSNPSYDTSKHQYYLNCILDVACALSPAALYQQIVGIEDEIGHSRLGKWLPRAIDIDLLFFALNDAREFNECSPQVFAGKEGLSVPHYDFWQRDFLLQLSEQGLGLDLSKLRTNHSLDRQLC